MLKMNESEVQASNILGKCNSQLVWRNILLHISHAGSTDIFDTELYCVSAIENKRILEFRFAVISSAILKRRTVKQFEILVVLRESYLHSCYRYLFFFSSNLDCLGLERASQLFCRDPFRQQESHR